MPPPSSSDDILHPKTSPPERDVRERPLRLHLPADPIAPSVARDQVRRWLTALSWPTSQLDDLALAISEAVSNAIEHAYLDQLSGLVKVHGEAEMILGGQRQVTVIVRDYGRWRPPPIDTENRRRGIPLMRACVEAVTIEQPDDDRAGTRVVLRSRAVPMA